MAKTNWKKLCTAIWTRLCKERPDLIEEAGQGHHLGGPGCLTADNTVWQGFATDDVAYEVLYFDARYLLEGR